MLRVLMAVSHDGYLCRDENDDMTWTGKIDKALFRLLTVGQRQPILVGRTTAEHMPFLQGRTVVMMRQSPLNGMTLRQANRYYPDAWLIGGPTVVRAALDDGLVSHLHLVCVPHVLGDGVPVTVLGTQINRWPDEVVTIAPVKVRIWRFDGKSHE